jgi:curved DNA-binding protein CbpA
MTNDLVVNSVVEPNPESDDLYEVLGVAKDASPIELQKAYRRASMKYHPDRNGGTLESGILFKKIKEAYETLSNPELREFYDNTGVRKFADVVLRDKAKELVTQTYAQVFDMAAQNNNYGFDIRFHDPVAVVISALNKSLANIIQQRTNLQRIIPRYENLFKRFKKKQGDFASSPLGNVLLQRISQNKKIFSMSAMDIKVHEFALELTVDYTCEPEPQSYEVTPFIYVGT